MLDYDGTLAPFRPQRDQAVPYPEVKELIAAIMATNTRVCVISGRQAVEVKNLLGLSPEIWGVYGLERFDPDGTYSCLPVPVPAIESLETAAAELAIEGLQSRTELKPGSVAVHWRGVSGLELNGLQLTAFQVLEPFTRNRLLILEQFDGGLELRFTGVDKGSSVRHLVRNEPEDVVLAYLGDDLADEAAFCAIAGKGLSVLVRPEYRITNANLWIVPPTELVMFLDEWLDVCGGGS